MELGSTSISKLFYLQEYFGLASNTLPLIGCSLRPTRQFDLLGMISNEEFFVLIHLIHRSAFTGEEHAHRPLDGRH